MDGTKPGWKTSEFYLTLLTNVIGVIGALKGVIPPQYATIALTVINSVYAIVRSFVKTTDTMPTASTVTVNATAQ